MNLKKIILILIIIFITTGCVSSDYNLTINKDLSINEEVFISATDEYFNLFYMDYKLTIVKGVYDNKEFMQILPNNNYSYKLIEEEKRPGVLINKKYNNLNDYTKETIFKNQSFEDIEYVEKDNLITITTKNFLPYVEDETNGRYPISDLNINIKVPYIVTSNNADNIDKVTNTYTWYINSETKDKKIEITFDKNKIYVYNLSMYIFIIILIILIFIVGIIVFKIVKKNKRNNKIYE